jgi:hypothetical protein
VHHWHSSRVTFFSLDLVFFYSVIKSSVSLLTLRIYGDFWRLQSSTIFASSPGRICSD